MIPADHRLCGLHIYRKTIGVDFGVKQVKIPERDCVVELFVFDCAGQGVFNKLEQVSETLYV